jgi:hypothetical protein
MMYFIQAICALYPQVVRTVGEDAFDADGNPVAYDRQAVEAKAAQLQAQQERATAYTNEADPLFFKAQRGEATIEEWQAKVAEIRSRYPYPAALEVT